MIFFFSSNSNRANGGKVGIPPRTALCTRAREPTSWKQIPSLSPAPSPGPGWMYLIVRGGEIELGRELGARNLSPPRRGARHAERDAVRGHACLNWHQAHKPGVPVKARRRRRRSARSAPAPACSSRPRPIGLRRCGDSSPRQLFRRCLL